MIGDCKYRIVVATIVRFALAVDPEDISKIRNNHPLRMYPFIRTRMEIVPMKEFRKFGINVYVH